MKEFQSRQITVIDCAPANDCRIPADDIKASRIQNSVISVAISRGSKSCLSRWGQTQRTDKSSKGYVIFQSNQANVVVQNGGFVKICNKIVKLQA